MAEDATHVATHVTTWTDAGPEAARAVLVHGTMSWGTECFAHQRPLADRFRLDLMDRRGYGQSPGTGRSDYEADAEDIAALLAQTSGGAHLVGHSYGAVAAMVAAARHPGSVRSLVLIEPSALGSAAGQPVVAAALARMRASFGTARPEMSPEQYLTMSTQPYGMPIPDFSAEMLRATRTAMDERPCWTDDVPLAPLAAAPFRKVVVNGTWESAHPELRAFNGEALAACGAYIADRTGARHVTVEGTDHFPHRDRPETVNRLLAETWSA
ncbi:alpha/beta fold hydrolase [Streptomyces sp. CA-111067]|uniref:alpha/beta fold hydrolase n=1 Tax=Streptomyces sp. CA-111067 TaxID=3240046 RepID=UPI003D96C7F8